MESLDTYIVELIRHKWDVFVLCDGLEVCPAYSMCAQFLSSGNGNGNTYRDTYSSKAAAEEHALLNFSVD